MHVIIIGAGQVGTYIARTLAVEGHDVVLIERNEALANTAEGSLDAMVIHGNGTSPSVLRQADVSQADMLVAVTDSDEANIIACLSAEQLGGATRTVARVRNSDYFETGTASTEGLLGIDYVIHPDRITADDLSEALLMPGAVNIEHFADNRLSVAEMITQEESPLIGGPLNGRRRTGDYLLAAVGHSGEPSIAFDATTVHVGDRVFVATERKNAKRVVAELAGSVEKVKHAILFGGTSIGVQLARRLRNRGINVKLVERDPKIAERVASTLDDVLVLQADELSRDFMLQEGVADVHAFVACSTDDGANLLAALNAKKLGAHMTLTVTQQAEYIPLVDTMDIDAAVSPRLHTAAAILRFVRKGRVIRLRQFESGAEIIELHAGKGDRICSKPLRECAWPDDAVMAGIVRNDKVMFPSGDDVVQEDDRVVVFTLQSAIRKVEQLFTD